MTYFQTFLFFSLQLFFSLNMLQSSPSEYTITKKQSKSKRLTHKDDSQRQGRWNSQQNLKYLIFLSFNLSKFQCKKKRMFRLYKPLSKFIQTRSSQQCRSHHRKLLQRFKTPKNIVLNLEQQFQREEIQQQREKTMELLKELPIPQKKQQDNQKQESFHENQEQKSWNKNSKQAMRREEKLEKEREIERSDIKQNETIELEERIKQIGQKGCIYNQALNWLNQMYMLQNYNYLTGQNYMELYYGLMGYSKI